MKVSASFIPTEGFNYCSCMPLFFSKVILLSESLKEAFSELDMTSEVLQITMSPSQPYFRCVAKTMFPF